MHGKSVRACCGENVVRSTKKRAHYSALFSANIPLVLKHYDKLSEAALIDDRKDRIVERRFVRLGETRGERVAIAEGAIAGERVVTAGQIKLQPNSPVMIDNANALPPPAQTPKS